MAAAVLLFLVGLVCLIKGGDWFVDGACGIARRFNLSELLIGATVVSIGTTLPEVMVSATSAFEGHSEIAYGNAIGSIICNTALIAALTMAVRPGNADKSRLKTPVLFFFAAAAFYCIMAYAKGGFSRIDGIILLCIFAVYMFISVKGMKTQDSPAPAQNTENTAAEGKPVKDILMLVVGAALIAVGARLLVDNGTKIAESLGVPESVIALTMVAIGTSLPELVTAITSLVKGHSSLSLGNIIGANLFNLVLVSGMAITIRPFSLPAGKTIAGFNAALVLDTPVMLFVMLFMTVPALLKGKLYRFQGIILLAVYAAFCVIQFTM